MLINSLFTVSEPEQKSDGLTAHVTMNRHHPIFAGHFPTVPILPGVCMTQLIKELIEQQTGQKLMLSKADSIKFMAVINPDETPSFDVNLSFEMHEQEIEGTASIFQETVTFFKLKASWKTS